MTKYDPDRLAALAAGSLDPAEAAALEAEIAADPRASAELAAQRLALDAVRRAPAPVLSADERTELRQAVAAALHLKDAEQPAAALTARRRLPWRPLAVAAVALAALVAAVPLFGLLSAGDDQSTMTTVALAVTTEARGETAVTPENDDLTNAGAGITPSEGTLLTGTTSAATTTTAFGTASYEERARADADQAVTDLLADPALLFAPGPTAEPVPCGDEARILLKNGEPTGLRLDSYGIDLAIWFLSADGASVQRLVALAPATCEFLAAYP
jgi:hypothetical protein